MRCAKVLLGNLVLLLKLEHQRECVVGNSGVGINVEGAIQVLLGAGVITVAQIAGA
ncbi:MAG: hypothetical protein U5O39_01515 [Gammaproteobacteria bacterium]|nr:hypothetical protein [Gammaproteobacteria bacterium]